MKHPGLADGRDDCQHLQHRTSKEESGEGLNALGKEVD